MIHAKNAFPLERLPRVLAGLALAVFGLIGLKETPLGYVLAASGAVAVLTGFAGFCPVCALAGRRIGENARKRREGDAP